MSYSPYKNFGPPIEQVKLYFSDMEYRKEITRLNFEIKRLKEELAATKRSKRTCKGWITKKSK